MIRALRQVAAFPLKVLYAIVSAIPIFQKESLVKPIWLISHDGAFGAQLVRMTWTKEGPEAGRRLAEEVLEKSRCAMVALVAGSAEAWSEGRVEAVDYWDRRARELNCKDHEYLLHLKLIRCELTGGDNREQIADEILGRNDLPASMTLMAMGNKADLLLERGQWEQAEAVVDRILAIQEWPLASIMKWAICLHKGLKAEAATHLGQAKGKLSEREYCFFIAQGYVYLGQREEAMEWLSEAVKHGMRVRRVPGPVGDLLVSGEFRDYCRRQMEEV